ncbi:unnamed protein product [Caenorhabditis sp. 36 PRJEB53466]|nr:unnamed protein product [Caenorhabditis sp. 36 PRJEB53466]
MNTSSAPNLTEIISECFSTLQKNIESIKMQHSTDNIIIERLVAKEKEVWKLAEQKNEAEKKVTELEKKVEMLEDRVSELQWERKEDREKMRKDEEHFMNRMAEMTDDLREAQGQCFEKDQILGILRDRLQKIGNSESRNILLFQQNQELLEGMRELKEKNARIEAKCAEMKTNETILQETLENSEKQMVTKNEELREKVEAMRRKEVTSNSIRLELEEELREATAALKRMEMRKGKEMGTGEEEEEDVMRKSQLDTIQEEEEYEEEDEGFVKIKRQRQ